MAITAAHYRFYKELKADGLLPQGGPILEIGEANWYGDVDCREFCDPPADGNLFTIAKQFYKSMFGVAETTAIDYNGTPESLRVDLNWIYAHQVVNNDYSVVINNGTAEHIFNVANVFRLMHHACKVGGLMIHDAPMQGWLDHGFYCLQPTLFWDLAHANQYEILSFRITDLRSTCEFDTRDRLLNASHSGGLPHPSLLLVVFAKKVDAPFRIPLQGIYDQRLSESAREAWQTMR